MKKLIILLAILLLGCASTSETVQQDPVFPENYILRGQDGHKVGYAVKVSEHEWRVFRDDGKIVILKDPLVEGGYLIFDSDRGGE